MSCDISSRRRNYMLVPHRRDGLIEWMKTMLMHSFVLNVRIYPFIFSSYKKTHT
jgi:hypothetical protein